jgi:thioesterase domain-containing protein/acyl carrier protein
MVTKDHAGHPNWKLFLQETLPNYMIPGSFVLLESMPYNSNGKIDKRALPDPPASIEHEREDYVEPQNELEQIIASIWQQLLGITNISINDSFFDLGGDSITSIQVVARLNEEGVKTDPKMIFMYPTIAQLAERIAALPRRTEVLQRTETDYLIELRAGAEAESRIFFAPPAGGTVLGYIELTRQLKQTGMVYALQSPGLYEDEEPQYLNYAELVQTFIKSIAQSFRPHIDYLAGHSMGGHVAYGMCQKLVRQGLPPKGLLILDTIPVLRADGEDVRLPEEMSEEEVKMFALVIGMGNLVGIPPERLQGLDYESAKKQILEEARKDDSIRRFMDDAYLDKYLKMQTHNMIMSQVLEMEKSPVPVPFFIFKSSEHPPDFEAKFKEWQEYSTMPCEYIEIPGDHVTMMRKPQVQNLASGMQAILDRKSLLV